MIAASTVAAILCVLAAFALEGQPAYRRARNALVALAIVLSALTVALVARESSVPFITWALEVVAIGVVAFLAGMALCALGIAVKSLAAYLGRRSF